ncbi:hypothetical protein BUALT_Bualt02G0241300 [Buddleja alternifolia]|uniref:Uncharacterized protein n=1 Tax=Buddleja alternifolia TaxID=168488 RepID=A0AAV6Y9Y6_9LAMI|nr:hypothetical protein BUALT_Bualt02G0241300 [Buddleja alternifolia]
MGNISSCFNSQSHTAKLIDLHRSTFRVVDVPVTAAELMLEEPGHVVSPVNDLSRDLRLSAMKADESLTGGKVYILIPLSRVNGKVSESEMAVIKSACCQRKMKRRSSRVIPVAAEIAAVDTNNPVKLVGDQGTDNGILSYRIKQQWKPALEPIREGI